VGDHQIKGVKSKRNSWEELSMQKYVGSMSFSSDLKDFTSWQKKKRILLMLTSKTALATF